MQGLRRDHVELLISIGTDWRRTSCVSLEVPLIILAGVFLCGDEFIRVERGIGFESGKSAMCFAIMSCAERVV